MQFSCIFGYKLKKEFKVFRTLAMERIVTAKKTASSRYRIPKRPFRILIAAAIVLTMGIAVMAVPFTRQYIVAALHLDAGESSMIDGITCLYNGTEKNYPTAEALMESEGIHFSLPRTTSDRYAIQKIVCVGDTNIVVLQLADTSIS